MPVQAKSQRAAVLAHPQNPTTAHETAVAAQFPYSLDPPYMAARMDDTPVHPTLHVVQGLYVGSANVAAPGAGEQQPQTAVAAAQPAVAPEQSIKPIKMICGYSC